MSEERSEYEIAKLKQALEILDHYGLKDSRDYQYLEDKLKYLEKSKQNNDVQIALLWAREDKNLVPLANYIDELEDRVEDLEYELLCMKHSLSGSTPPMRLKKKMNPESIKRGLEQALEHAQNESIMRSMLRFVIKERRYLHRMWMIQERECRNSEFRNNNFWIMWIEVRIICKKLINIYRAK